MAMPSSLRATLSKPVLEVVTREFGTGAGHLLKLHNRNASALANKQIEKKQGNIIKVPLMRGSGGRAGKGYQLHLNSRTSNEHIEFTTNGHYNYGTEFTLHDSKYEAQYRELAELDAKYAGEAFAREFVDNYVDELTFGHNYVPFNPASAATSYTSVLTLMKRQGMNSLAIHNQRHTNVNNELMGVNEGMFTWVQEVDSIPTYKTGDRTGLCLKVYSACQSGCRIYISGGQDAANRKIILRGETIEIGGVRALDEHTHRSQGYLRQFTAACDVWADSNGVAEVSIDPELLPLNEDYSAPTLIGQTASNGGRKNVDFAPRDGAPVTVSRGLQPNCEYEQSLIWYEDAMLKVIADISMDSDHFNKTQMKMNSMRGKQKITDVMSNVYMSKDKDIFTGKSIMRWDTSLDFINFRPELVTRLVGIKVADLGA